MDFNEHRAASTIVEFDDTRAEKLKKNQTSTTQIFFNFSQNVGNRQRKWSIKRKYGVTEHLRELNPCIDIKVPTNAIYLHISSTARGLNA